MSPFKGTDPSAPVKTVHSQAETNSAAKDGQEKGRHMQGSAISADTGLKDQQGQQTAQWPTTSQQTMFVGIPQESYELSVSHISVVVYENVSEVVDKVITNGHWVTYLETHDPKDTILIDMNVRADLSTGVLMIQHDPYKSRDKIPIAHCRTFDSGRVPCTFGMVLQLLKMPDSCNDGLRLERYKFTAEGTGCAWWIYHFITKLEGQEYLAEGSASIMNNDLHWIWSHGQPISRRRDEDIPRGKFY
jgi:hypothetical protein